MYKVVLSSRFRKDYSRCFRRGMPVEKIDRAMRILASGATLPPEYADHPLKGEYAGSRECHLGGPKSDWLLQYRKQDKILELRMVRTGTHRDLGFEK